MSAGMCHEKIALIHTISISERNKSGRDDDVTTSLPLPLAAHQFLALAKPRL
jgi:hypothetical protein